MPLTPPRSGASLIRRQGRESQLHLAYMSLTRTEKTLTVALVSVTTGNLEYGAYG
jgi:hypothetical protein